MGFLNDYFTYQRTYQEKFGPKTAVLIQKGTFYEIYEYDPSKSDGNAPDHGFTERIGCARELSPILNLFLSSSDKAKPHNFSNPYMIGIPVMAYEKSRDILLSHDYTIIRIDEINNFSNNKGKDREVAEILSAGTEIDGGGPIPGQSSLSNQIVSIYIECQKSSKLCDDYSIITGVSSIDVTTGDNIVGEIYSQKGNNMQALQEIYRFLTLQRPREVILHLKTTNIKMTDDQIDKYSTSIYDTLELNKYPTLIAKVNDMDSNIIKTSYQEQFLEKIFPPHTNIQTNLQSNSHTNSQTNIHTHTNIQTKVPMVSSSQLPGVIERLDLERMSYGIISYISLLQYCYEHNEVIIQKIKKPKTSWIDESKHLILAHNAINQLDLLPSSFSLTRNNSRNFGTPGKMSNRTSIKRRIDSLLSVVDETSTRGGNAYLQNMLLNPIIDSNELNKYYNITEELINDNNLLHKIETHFKNIPDLERLHRKLSISKIKPQELSCLYNGYIKITSLFGTLIEFIYKVDPSLGATIQKPSLASIMPDNDFFTNFNSCLQYMHTSIDFDILTKVKILENKLSGRMDIDRSFLHPGFNSQIDQLSSNIKICQDELESICSYLNGFLDGSFGGKKTTGKLLSPLFKRSNKNDDGQKNTNVYVTIVTTASKVKTLKSRMDEIDVEKCGNLEFFSMGKDMGITSDRIKEFSTCWEHSKSLLEKQLYQIYHEILSKLSNDFDFYVKLSDFISLLDYLKSNARVALKFKYFKPTIIDHAKSSFLSVTDIRHPIIEQICQSEYIPNNLSLGTIPKMNSSSVNISSQTNLANGNSINSLTDNSNSIGSNSNLIKTIDALLDLDLGKADETQKNVKDDESKIDALGMLLYGVNSSGKSSLTKSVGLIIIMAQAGMFVPGHLIYKPYHRINTRLSGNDDIFKGHSSFIVEMLELRSILKNSDGNTLVLGDELCRGTESTSGTSLTISTIERLISNKTSFIFSTHMHNLPKFHSIRKMTDKELRICHLSTHYDETMDDLIFDRKLKPGPGNSVYGLEVCKSLSIDPDFLNRANEIRREFEGLDSILTTKKSRYNSNVYVDTCSICGKNERDAKSHLETHHIKEQSTADSNGFIGTFHKNSSFNLIALCPECHSKLHLSKSSLVPIQTLNGVRLKMTNNHPPCLDIQ